MSDFIILIAIIIAGFLVANKFQKNFMSQQKNETIEIKPKLPQKTLIGIIIAIIIVVLGFNSFVVVSGGHVACIYDIGRGILEKIYYRDYI